MVDGLRHWRQPWAKNVFGYSVFLDILLLLQIIMTDRRFSRYAESLAKYYTSTMDIKTLFRSFYHENTSNVDIVQPLITFLVSLLIIKNSLCCLH